MKKNITKKLLAAFAVAMLFTGLSQAQILTNWVEGGAAAADAAEREDSVTVGTQNRFFAEPDPYYSPSYAPATNTNLGANQRWTWTAVDDVSGITAGFPATNIDTNMVTITFGSTVGVDTIGVVETTTVGSCAGAQTKLAVHVLAAPTVTFAADGVDTIGADLVACENDPSLDGSLVPYAKFTGIPSYQLDYALEIFTLTDPANQASIDDFYGSNKIVISAAPAAVGDTALTYETDDNDQITAIANNYYALALPDDGEYTPVNGQATIYRYSIMGTSGRISRKSDYLSNPTGATNAWTVYDTTVERITIQVNPAPTTGPIYHISNTWVN